MCSRQQRQRQHLVSLISLTPGVLTFSLEMTLPRRQQPFADTSTASKPFIVAMTLMAAMLCSVVMACLANRAESQGRVRIMAAKGNSYTHIKIFLFWQFSRKTVLFFFMCYTSSRIFLSRWGSLDSLCRRYLNKLI
jgi:hypothetical protein